MKIVAELNDEEIEVLRKIKQHCLNRNDCDNCIFDNGEGNCNATKVWKRLEDFNISPEDIK